MMRAATFLWALMATTAGTGLFLLKYQVQAEERHLRELRKDIAGTEQSIHVLKAEWSYLNDPVRLREQAEHHLGMTPMRANQIVAIDQIPMNGEAPYTPPAMIKAKAPPPVARESHKPAPSPPAGHGRPPAGGHGLMVTAKRHAGPRDPEVASSKVRP